MSRKRSVFRPTRAWSGERRHPVSPAGQAESQAAGAIAEFSLSGGELVELPELSLFGGSGFCKASQRATRSAKPHSSSGTKWLKPLSTKLTVAGLPFLDSYGCSARAAHSGRFSGPPKNPSATRTGAARFAGRRACCPTPCNRPIEPSPVIRTLSASASTKTAPISRLGRRKVTDILLVARYRADSLARVRSRFRRGPNRRPRAIVVASFFKNPVCTSLVEKCAAAAGAAFPGGKRPASHSISVSAISKVLTAWRHCSQSSHPQASATRAQQPDEERAAY